MNSRLVRFLVFWNVASSVLLLVAIAMYASAAQAANDPPVRAFTASTAHVGSARGGATMNPIEVSRRDVWTQLLKVSVNLSDNHNHECTAIVSSHAYNYPGNSEDNTNLS
ncbi:MAG: hypothetical protein HY741_02700 [Chloroflexi bacterium]|nr:hypothetical protein [Chloroflexota bacterium]